MPPMTAHAQHMPTTHTLRISLGFPESLAINASASKVEFHLHERARAIVSYLQSSWGERWIANLFHGIIRGTASRCAGVEPLMVDIGAPPAAHFLRAAHRTHAYAPRAH